MTEVTADHQLEPARHRVSLDDRDGGLLQVEHVVLDARGHLGDLDGLGGRAQELPAQHVEVGAGAERVPAAPKEHHAHRRVALGAVQRASPNW